METLSRLMKEIGIPETLGRYGIPKNAAWQLAQDGIKQKDYWPVARHI